jgi:hypothetical protein
LGVVVGLIVVNLLLSTQIQNFYRNNLLSSLNSYGVVRIVNQVASVLKHSSVNISLLGVGGELAVGEVLDPLDDATERLSDLFTIGIWVWGGEMILAEILAKVWPYLLIGALLLSLLPEGLGARGFPILILFLALPITTYLVGEWLNTHFFNQALSTTTSQIEALLHQLPSISTTSQLIEVLKNPAQLERVGVELIQQVVLLGVYYFGKLLFSVVAIPWVTYQIGVGILRGSNR